MIGLAYDLLIKNGRVIDGAGNPWYRGDVAVEGDRVAIALTKLAKGTLVLAIVPFADVYVNGENVGREKTRYVASLDPGKYAIRLSNPNFEPIEEELEILPGDSTVKTYNFMTKARP